MDVETSAAADSEAPKVRFTALFLQPDLLSYREEMRILDRNTVMLWEYNQKQLQILHSHHSKAIATYASQNHTKQNNVIRFVSRTQNATPYIRAAAID